MSEPTLPPDELRPKPVDPPQLPVQLCKKCGASNPPHATSCWLCDDSAKRNPYSPADLQPKSAAASGVGDRDEPRSRVDGVFSLLLGAVLLLTLMVGVGLASQDIGLIVPYILLVGPAVIATGIKAMASSVGQGRPTAGSLLWTFLWSMFMTVSTIILLMVAAVVLLFMLCASLGGFVGPH